MATPSENPNVQADGAETEKSDDTPRRASWLELFYDLVFVVLVSKVTHVLLHLDHGELPLTYYGQFALLMVLLWALWSTHTLYVNRYGDRHLWQRLGTCAQMLTVLMMSEFINQGVKYGFSGFVVAATVFRLLNVWMLVRAAHLDDREDASRAGRGLAIFGAGGAAAGLAALALPHPWDYGLFLASALVEIAPAVVGSKRWREMPLDQDHLPERFGLLTLILAGEAVVSLAAVFDSIENSPAAIGVALAGFVLVVSVWWLYFDNVADLVAGEKGRSGRAIVLGHLPIFTGLGGLAAGTRFALGEPLKVGEYNALMGLSALLFMSGIWGMVATYLPAGPARRGLLVRAAAFLAVLAAGWVFSPSVYASLAGITALFAAYTAWVAHASEDTLREVEKEKDKDKGKEKDKNTDGAGAPEPGPN